MKRQLIFDENLSKDLIKSNKPPLFNKQTFQVWLKDAMQRSKLQPAKTSVLLGLYGLQNAADVLNFIHSPAGETVYEIISEELSKLETIHRQQRVSALHLLNKRKMLAAYILLGLLYKHKLKARTFEITLHNLTSKSSISTANNHAVIAAVEAYQLSIEGLSEKLAEKLLAAEQIEKLIQELQNDEKNLTNQFVSLEQTLNFTDKFLLELPNTNKNLEDMELAISDKFHLVDHELSIITKQLQDHDLEILDMQNLIKKHSALNLQSLILKEFIKPESSYYVPNLNLQNLIPPSHVIVFDQGYYHLLRKNINFQELDMESKISARTAYKNYTILSNIKQEVFDTKKKSFEIHYQKKDNLTKEAEKLQSSIYQLSQQINKLKFDQTKLIVQHKLYSIKNKSKIEPIDDKKTKDKLEVPVNTTQVFKHMLALTKLNPNETSLHRLCDSLPANSTYNSLKQSLTKFMRLGVDAAYDFLNTNINELNKHELEKTSNYTPFSTTPEPMKK